jgi:hypothetical protein
MPETPHFGERASETGTDRSERPYLVGYRIQQERGEEIVPATPFHRWSDVLDDFHRLTAQNMELASQFGWVLLNPTPFLALWDGGNALSSTLVDTLGVATPDTASSHFGYGILTWNPGYVFRTPPGWNLHARGPANWPRRGIIPLEGIVETDWAEATFTMNWQITERNFPIVFEAGEPYCMLVPRRRGELESFQPAIVPLESDPDAAAAYRRWTDPANSRVLDRQPRPLTLSAVTDPFRSSPVENDQ